MAASSKIKLWKRLTSGAEFELDEGVRKYLLDQIEETQRVGAISSKSSQSAPALTTAASEGAGQTEEQTEEQTEVQKLWEALADTFAILCPDDWPAEGEKPPLGPSAVWKKVGFQSEDPRKDLRAWGGVALAALATACGRHKREVRAIVAANYPRNENTFPFVCCVINIVQRLFSLLFHSSSVSAIKAILSGPLQRLPVKKWKELHAFAVLYSTSADPSILVSQLAFSVLSAFHSSWLASKATYMDFNPLLDRTIETFRISLIDSTLSLQ